MKDAYVILLNQEIPMPRNINKDESKEDYREFLREYLIGYFPKKEKENFESKKDYAKYIVEYQISLNLQEKKLYNTAMKFYKKDKWYRRLGNWFKSALLPEEYEENIIEEESNDEINVEDLSKKIIEQVEKELQMPEVEEKKENKFKLFSKKFFGKIKNIFKNDKEVEIIDEEEVTKVDEVFIESLAKNNEKLNQVYEETLKINNELVEESKKLIEANKELVKINKNLEKRNEELVKNLKIQEENIKRLEKEVLKLKPNIYDPNNIMVKHAYEEAKKEDEERRIRAIIEKSDISDFEFRMGSLEASPAINLDMNKVLVKRK